MLVEELGVVWSGDWWFFVSATAQFAYLREGGVIAGGVAWFVPLEELCEIEWTWLSCCDYGGSV